MVGATAWQWLGLAIGFLIGGLIIWLGHRGGRRGAGYSEDAPGPHWRALLLPLAIMFVAGLLVPFFGTVLRTGGNVLVTEVHADRRSVS